MDLIITAVGPDHSGLADPIVHYVTGNGANIAEIQMYDHDQERLFAMLLRFQMPAEQYDDVCRAMSQIGQLKNLSIRVWTPDLRRNKPRLAICVTSRSEPPLALMRAIRDRRLKADVAL